MVRQSLNPWVITDCYGCLFVPAISWNAAECVRLLEATYKLPMIGVHSECY